MLNRFERQVDFPVDLCLMDQLLALHGFFEHLAAEFLAHEPPCSVVVLILNLSDTCLGWHLLKAIDHSQVLRLHVVVKVAEAAKFFGEHGTF